MGRAVFASADRIVGEYETGPIFIRRLAQRIARNIREHQEGAAVGLEAAVRQAVHDRGPCRIAHAVIL